jgi:hypothetical protein
MSCRIERLVTGEDGVVLRVSGRIQPEHVATLRHSLGRERGRLAIDLKDVLLVAREAVQFLARSEAHGIMLQNCPAYIRHWIARVRSDTGLRSSERDAESRGDIDDV